MDRKSAADYSQQWFSTMVAHFRWVQSVGIFHFDRNGLFPSSTRDRDAQFDHTWMGASRRFRGHLRRVRLRRHTFTNSPMSMCRYRLTPEHPFPAGLDDCMAVTKFFLDCDEARQFRIDANRSPHTSLVVMLWSILSFNSSIACFRRTQYQLCTSSVSDAVDYKYSSWLRTLHFSCNPNSRCC